MPNNYWIKLYHEILHDPKMGRLPDNVWRRCIELFLLAGEIDSDGDLPNTDDLAWLLHQPDPEQLEAELRHLEKVGVLAETESGWFVVSFAKRQAKVSDAERMRSYRKRKRMAEMDEYDPSAADELAEDTQRDGNVSPPVTSNDAETLRNGYEVVTRTVTSRNTESDIDSTSYEVTEKSVSAADKSSRTKRDVDKSSLPSGEDLLQAETPLKQIMGTFLVKTSYKLPTKKSNRNFWWSEVRELLNIADGDAKKAQTLVEMAVDEMNDSNLSIGSPKSIVSTAQRLAGSLTDNGQKIVASY